MNWSRFKHWYMIFNIVVVLVGGAYLGYLTQIDGIYFNKPITFHVDIQNLQTDKTVYHRGDTVSLKWAFCKNRNFTAVTTYLLVNTTITTYTPKGPVRLQTGCYGLDKVRYVEAIEILPTAQDGTHHIEGSSQYTLDGNPLNQITIHFRSQQFEVI